MSDDAPQPEPDRVDGAPHPRETARLFGQDEAERLFLDAAGAGRLHHGWLLTGPRGVGKATLAYRIARRMIADGAAPQEAGLFGEAAPESLDAPPGCPVRAQIAAGAHPQLHVLRRPFDHKAGRLKTVITVDEVREIRRFFELTAADGGWRVALVDAADELNPSAANALLKTLEEPPPRAMLLLVAHAPARLLPTIRSRCRRLALTPLGQADFETALAAAGLTGAAVADPALSTLAGGSPGEALRLMAEGGPALYAEIAALAESAPQIDRGRLGALAGTATGRDAAGRYDLMLRIAGAWTAGRAKSAALAQDAAAARRWAGAVEEIEALAQRAQAVNLDPAQTVLEAFRRIEVAAR